MASNAPPRAILFDLDSALISRGLSLTSFAERFAAHFVDRLGGVTVRGVAYGLSEVDGNGFRSHAELAAELLDLFPWSLRPSLEELTAYWDAVYPRRVALDAEALPTLRWLREHGIALGLMAPGWPDMQRAKIATLELDSYFAVTLLAGENGEKEWDAHTYRQAAEMLGTPPAEVWMVSGLQEDCLAARDARLGVIFLQHAYYWPRDAEPPTHEIATLGELVATLGDITGGDTGGDAIDGAR